MPIATPEKYAEMIDPRSWGAAAEAGMAARVLEAAQQLRSASKTIK